MSVISFFTAWFNRRTDSATKIQHFGLLKTRLNGHVEVDTTEYLINNDFLITHAPEGSLTVRGIGTANMLGVNVINHYLEDATGNDNYWIQEVSTEKQIHNLFLFSQVDEIVPQTPSQWQEIHDLLHSNESWTNQNTNTVYECLWHQPQTYTETYEDTPNKETQSTTARLYKRVYQHSDDPQQPLLEYLYVCIEDESVVRIYAGLELTPASINVF